MKLNLILSILIIAFLPLMVIGMNSQQVQTAFVAGDTVWYAPQEVYDYLAWQRSTMPGAPFGSTTRIPNGKISQMTNVPTVVDGQLVDDWTATVNGVAMQLNRLYISEGALKTALKGALLAKVQQATAIATRDAGYAESVDEIGVPILTLSTNALDFGSATTVLTFNITNTGDGDLDWTITSSIPAKIAVSPTSGNTQDETDTITVTVNRTGIVKGTYAPTIEIVSDGGNATVTLNVVVP